MLAATKVKRCKHCRARFPDAKPWETLHPECMRPYADKVEAKSIRAAGKKHRAALAAGRAADKQKRDENKPRSKWQAEAQAAVNAFVRERDRDLPCISCGRMHQGQNHAGHYRSRGAAKHLALEPGNIFKQCYPCNVELHGNLIAYRSGFIARAGLAAVEAIEADNTPRHHSIDDLKAIKALYVELTKQLKREMG